MKACQPWIAALFLIGIFCCVAIGVPSTAGDRPFTLEEVLSAP